MLKKQIKLQKWNPPKNYQYDIINVWAPQSMRQQHVVRLLLSNPQEVQKMASNPIYKEVHDNVLAKVKKSKNQLSKQKMFTPRFPKRMFYWYNFQALGYIVLMVPAYYFIKDRLFFQTIQKRRSIGLSDKFGIDYEDVQNYPKAALQILQERRRNDAYIQKKEKNIQNTQTLFKEFSETRAHDLKKARMEVGLKTSQ